MKISAVLAVVLTAAPSFAHVINDSIRAWTNAAEVSRADMLIFGDSVTLHNGDGWDAGFNRSLHNQFGLAGTGLVPTGGTPGEGFTFHTVNSYGWTTGTGAIPEASRRYSVLGNGFTAGPTPAGNLTIGIGSGGTLAPNAAYTLDAYVTGVKSDATLGAYRRLGVPGYSRFQTVAPVAVTPSDGVQKLSFDLDETGSTQPQELRLEGATNLSVLYSRLQKPGASGATVTSIGYGGRSTLDFYLDIYQNGFGSAEGRIRWLEAITDGGSGYLNVVIAEGFNDRNENSPSVNGIADGNSPEAFADNISALLSAVRADWNAAGRDPAKLSFLLLGMYDISDHDAVLRDYAAELEQIALTTPDVSFVDVYELAPSYEAATAQGFFVDHIHISRNGALKYADLIVQTIVPEPAMLAPITLLTMLLRRGRRKPY